MSYMEINSGHAPSGFSKILYLNWPVVLLLCAISCIGFLMLYSVAGGSVNPWLVPQVKRFIAGMTVLFFIAMTPIWFWRNVSGVFYLGSVLLLVAVEFFGETGMGAQRWLDLGFIRLQPSELTKITTVLFLAAYYDRLNLEQTSKLLWVLIPVIIIIIPVFLTLRQPDLGTALLILLGGSAVIFLAGVHWSYFAAVISLVGALVVVVLKAQNTKWALLREYQYNRIETFLYPSSDPLGTGYHITQSKIALGSGGLNGRGFMQGTQSRLNFLPEKHTDFIFTTLAEEFGFFGGLSVLLMYAAVIIFCVLSALSNKDRFSFLTIMGVSIIFFLYFSVNMAMVMGFAPIVGVPLPLISYGGSSMIVLLCAFGFMQSAHVHRLR
ncbi:MAG: rod shape-determining protein RodA [Proteobacteria bacterium]|jgi:rod shape determining protein RodA|nr:rod shape-determining protein RodA [Pseudomonadota bacterium]MDA1237421.1 rod shape-determining protein RodA [Pseudomonadota bacterium]